ncbi:MAG: hypothetical protein HKN18_00030 [Silicimonas sp.]|nr:hypothetical protein [Silicimonas sp.]
MYEFLAPWGVLAPALSAAFAYAIASNARRRQLLGAIQAPTGAKPQPQSDPTSRWVD